MTGGHHDSSAMVDTIRQALHDAGYGCTEKPGGHQDLAETITARLPRPRLTIADIKTAAFGLWATPDVPGLSTFLHTIGFDIEHNVEEPS